MDFVRSNPQAVRLAIPFRDYFTTHRDMARTLWLRGSVVLWFCGSVTLCSTTHHAGVGWKISDQQPRMHHQVTTR